VLAELTAASRPWLAINMAGRAEQARSALGGSGVTVVGLADPRVPPVMINPPEPEPGFGIQAHARRLAELLEAVLSQPDRIARRTWGLMATATG
jgi:uncharacterized protein